MDDSSASAEGLTGLRNGRGFCSEDEVQGGVQGPRDDGCWAVVEQNLHSAIE